MKHYLEIVELKTSEVSLRLDTTEYSERKRERLEMGMLMRIDTDNFYVNDRESETELELIK